MMSSTATRIATASSSSVSSSPVLSYSDGRGGVLRRKSPDGSAAVPQHAVQNDENNSNSNGDPLPPDLRRILAEVARTGRSSWLSWNSNSNNSQQESVSETGGTAASSSNLWKNTGKNNSRRTLAQCRNATSSSGSYNPRSSSPLHSSVPPRKKRRNGMYSMSRRRFDSGGGGKSSNPSNGTTTTRKRPLFLIRTTSSSSGMFSTGSVGSGRTSGSEPEDSTQYECDSEGTSATTNSEMSLNERREQQLRNKVAIQNSSTAAASACVNNNANSTAGNNAAHAPKYASLREAVQVALGLVLDHAYKHRGGYKLSPAELRRNATATGKQSEKAQQQQSEKSEASDNTKEHPDTIPLSPETAFQQRRKRLLALLGDRGRDVNDTARKGSDATGDSSDTGGGKRVARSLAGSIIDGPPFTLQRVAEVLVSPERYYTQTHKLCNCLEKLLLVTSSSTAFGGSTGGDTSQSRREERELAALANEKGRERRLRRRPSSSSEDIPLDVNDSHGSLSKGHDGSSPVYSSMGDAKKGAVHSSPEKTKTEADGASDHAHGTHSTNHGPGSREYLEAAARASLRSKFDHVAIDAHAASASVERESGGRPSSPPPPTHNAALQDRYVRQHLQEHAPGEPFNDSIAHNHHLMAARPHSPILFSSSTTSDSGTPAPAATTPTPIKPLSPNSNMQLLQMQHSAALATLNRTPLDLVIDPSSSGHSSTPASITAAALLEADPGRSSASNSDVDSESDDISLDDSASDRSDGSDSGSGTAHYEPFTAARVMALNRMQQQQQRLQNRNASSSQHPEGFRPPADSEYQSGDSIDSMVAEDSGGSDSSSSDMAD